MPEKWTGELIGRMHNERVTAADLAEELGCTKAYISMIFHGARTPEGAQEKLEGAFERILERRGAVAS
jgi:transcriptional regulator with XRE-family HTH domain